MNPIAQIKNELVGNVNVDKAFASVTDAMRREAETVASAFDAGKSVVPEIDYASIDKGLVSKQAIDQIRQRGCVVIRGVYPETQANEWNQEMGEYLSANNYHNKAKEKAHLDNYFGDLADAEPQIFGVYWSKPQVMARQGESMAATKRFLNKLWDVSNPVGDEFDPNHDFAYADRTRRRSPGDTTLGLSPHMDSGSFERWIDPAYRQIYASVFSGDWQRYDPWRAAYRTQTRELSSPAVCSMFRTFQGWTALTRQGPGDGTLQLIPIANAIAYVLLRSLKKDVPEAEFCLAKPGRALGVDEQWHPDIMQGLISIPEVGPGDTVWWHPDVVHAVGNEHHGSDYASVIYIGASPSCQKNKYYAAKQAQAFLAGKSAPDFAAEDYEVNFDGRATIDDLTELGKQQMGFALS